MIDILWYKAKCAPLFTLATGQDLFPLLSAKRKWVVAELSGRTQAFLGNRCRLLEGDISFLFLAPRLYGDRVPVNLIRTTSSKVRQKIVDIHNYFRTQVKPSAANMLVMVRTPFLYSSNKGENPDSRLVRLNKLPARKLPARHWMMIIYQISIRKYRFRIRRRLSLEFCALALDHFMYHVYGNLLSEYSIMQ